MITLYYLAKMALFWALLGKSSTISKHYRHKLWKFALFLTTALILSVKNGYSINWYICVRSTTSSLKSTPIMTAGHGDISVQGFVTAQKKCMYTSVDLLPDGQNVQLFWCCNLSNCCRSVHFFQLNESEHVVLHIIIIGSAEALPILCVRYFRWERERERERYRERKTEL